LIVPPKWTKTIDNFLQKMSVAKKVQKFRLHMWNAKSQRKLICNCRNLWRNPKTESKNQVADTCCILQQKQLYVVAWWVFFYCCCLRQLTCFKLIFYFIGYLVSNIATASQFFMSGLIN